MRQITSNVRAATVVKDVTEIQPGLSTVMFQRTKNGTGKVWYPGIMIHVVPDHFHTQGVAIRGEVRPVSNGWRKGAWKATLWKPMPGALPDRYCSAYFEDGEKAARWMAAAAPEFFS